MLNESNRFMKVEFWDSMSTYEKIERLEVETLHLLEVIIKFLIRRSLLPPPSPVHRTVRTINSSIVNTDAGIMYNCCSNDVEFHLR